MHTMWVRANAVLFYGLAVLSGICTLSWGSTLFYQASPAIDVLKINTVKRLTSHRGVDRAVVTLDTTCDLSSVFHWNVKQLFVFMTAEYQTDAFALNQVVIFDKIIQTPEEAEFSLTNEWNKYMLLDIGEELRGRDVSLKLGWDVMPLFGPLEIQYGGEHNFTLPDAYG